MGIRRERGESGLSITGLLQRFSKSSTSPAAGHQLSRQGPEASKGWQETGYLNLQVSYDATLSSPGSKVYTGRDSEENKSESFSVHRSYAYVCLPVPINRIDCEKWMDLPTSCTNRLKERDLFSGYCPNCHPGPQKREKVSNIPGNYEWPKLVDFLVIELLTPARRDSTTPEKRNEDSFDANKRPAFNASSPEASVKKWFREFQEDSRSHGNIISMSKNRQVSGQEDLDSQLNSKAQNIRSGLHFLQSSPFARLTGDFREAAIVLPDGRRDVEENVVAKAESIENKRSATAAVNGDVVPARKRQEDDSQGKDQRPLLKGFKLPAVPEIEKLRPKMEYLRSSFPNASFGEIMEKVLHWGRSAQDFPNKQKLSSVQEFFRYTEFEGRKLFDELDADGDGQVRLEDLELAMKKRRLPVQYARSFLRRTRRNWFSKSFGWEEFQMLMEQKEAAMLRAFNSLNLSSSGTLQKSQVLASLKRASLPATEDNARAMLQYLNVDMERGQVAYGQFRNFLLLLPPERLDRDPSMVWFEAATVVPMAPPVAAPAGSVLKSALAGGLASGLSTCIMHPLDTLKTRVQASPVSLGEVVQGLPKIGLEGLYRGSVPAIIGQFASHGLRTGVFEATKIFLQHLAPELTEMQVQPMASLCSTVLGTALRIPCEVLKQRLQAGMYGNAVDAIRGTLKQEGPMGLFRGTTATLCREVPFYVAGLLIYQEAKKVARHTLKRELAPWETLLVGGVSGGLAAVCTTPFDVIKTRMMVASPGGPTGLVGIGVAIVASEGVLSLYKGALPRFFWIAPLGAMNFAGYELAKQAMEAEKAGDKASSKVLLSSVN